MKISGAISIRWKLSLIIMAACLVAVLLVGLSLVVYEMRSLRAGMVRHLNAVAHILEENIHPSLTFDDRKTAEEVLKTVAGDDLISGACVLDAKGNVYVKFVREGARDEWALPPVDGVDGHKFTPKHLWVIHPINVGGAFEGTVLLRAGLEEFYSRIRVFFLFSGCSLLASLGVAFLISTRLQRVISKPLVELAVLARRIGQERDYSARAPRRTADEIGQLIDSFNGMLGEIEVRDDELRRAHEVLEQRVEERTADLRREISERLRAEEDLKQSAHLAEAASRAKSEFLAVMSHEIRTPMNGVIGCTNLLFETSLTEEQREYAGTIQQSGRALLALINDILDFSKIEAGRMELEQIPFDLCEAVEEVAELLSTQAETKGLELALSFHPDTPRGVVGDPGRVRQVLLNLVGNAIKFTGQGHVTLELAMENASSGPRFIRCSIHDTGIGIPEEKRHQLFREFSQLDSSTTRRFGGTGLGLAISRRLVELMGGRIGVADRVGGGSTFWFTLPAPTERTPCESASVEIETIKGSRILIVDDIEVNRRVLGLQLRCWGLHHQSVDSGAAALAALRAAAQEGRPFHIALLDHLMPEMDGEMLGREIFADPVLRSTALILVTSGSHRGDAKRFLDLGFSGFLLKPVVRPVQLLGILARTWRERFAIPGNPAAAMPAGNSIARVRRSPADESAPVLPLKEGGDPALRPEQSSPRARVLVVEDNAVNQRVAMRLLEKLGCRVDVAGDGREGISMVRRFPYDLVLMDCLMPEMDGFEATARIRQHEEERSANVANHRRLPIVALTANARDEDRKRCLEAGMDDHLAKPVVKTALQAVLERWVNCSDNSVAVVSPVTAEL